MLPLWFYIPLFGHSNLQRKPKERSILKLSFKERSILKLSYVSRDWIEASLLCLLLILDFKLILNEVF